MASLPDLGTLTGSDGGDAGLTPDGVRDAVTQYCEFEGYQRGTLRSSQSIVDMYRALIVRPDPLPRDELMQHFRSVDQNPNPDVGAYDELQARQWWTEVGKPHLAALPGIEETDDGWRFIGVDPAGFDDDYVRPLADLRDDPRVRAERSLDDLGVDRRSDAREAVLKLWDTLAAAESESISAAALDDAHRLVDLADHCETLADLPGVEREVIEPPSPEEHPIETYADVIEAREAVNREPDVEWTIRDAIV